MSRDPPLPENLPQYGFGPETAFKNLVGKNVFLFRVYTPHPRVSGCSEPPFLAPKFDRCFASGDHSPSPEPPRPTYADAARHMDWTTRHSSRYVSASLSLMWAVWEALRRYHFGMKHDVQIAVIDAGAVVERAVTVVELLQSVPAIERHESHWKWYRFANESQSVLIYGAIPQHAILASVPLLHILDNLPSYCLRPSTDSPPATPIQRVSWVYPTANPSYRRFCAAQTASFLSAAPEARFSDSTAAAVQLALALLGPWFHWMLRLRAAHENHPAIFRDAAVAKVSELGRAIALWPAAPETLAKWDRVVREISLLIAEEADMHSRIAGVGPISRKPSGLKLKSNVDVPVPVVLDARNYLPTPPPSPPPAPSASCPASLSLYATALSPHSPNTDTGAEKCRETPIVPDAGLLECPPPSARAEPPPAETKDIPPQSAPSDAHIHSKGETASCLLTGFFFGALIIIVLSSQRRPTLMQLS
ncbi:hypothetical protein FB451DRAFT_1556490 [Mycena latifolia]|nr:hypothetical protein FB451DRAFT_1556490 [Mycena latifolia]